MAEAASISAYCQYCWLPLQCHHQPVRLVCGLRSCDHGFSHKNWATLAASWGTQLCLLFQLTHRQNSDIRNRSTAACLPTLISCYSPAFDHIPKTHLKFGEHTFSGWNTLPLDVRTADYTDTFKWRLKTFLFYKFYQLHFPTAFV